LVVLTVAAIFALPLRRLVDSLSSVEVGAGKVKIRREFKDAIESTDEAIAAFKETTANVPADAGKKAKEAGWSEEASTSAGNPWFDVVEESPLLAVLRSWEGLQTSIFALATATIPSSTTITTDLQIGLTATLESLRDGRVVNLSFITAVEELRGIRDKVARGQSDPNTSEALAFVTSAWQLTRATRAISLLRALKGNR
jgi:hypothetical protein